MNFAAESHVDRSLINAGAFGQTDVYGTHVLLKAAKKHRHQRFVQVSTDYVCDGRKGEAYAETDRPNPLSVYGRSKYKGELQVLNSSASAWVLRTAWLYAAQGKNFVRAIQAAAARGGPLKVVADQVGSPTWTRHPAQAINDLIRSPTHGLFHVANRGACSRFEFARAIVGPGVDVEPGHAAEAARAACRPHTAC